MLISDKVKKHLLNLFAVDPIMKKCAVPGIVGMVCIAYGVVKKVTWLKIIGGMLIVPLVWCHFVIIFVYMPILILNNFKNHK